MVGIVTAVVMLLAATVPIVEVSEVSGFYDAYYYVPASGVSGLGGGTTSMGLMIGGTLRGLVRIGGPESMSDLLESSESSDSEE